MDKPEQTSPLGLESPGGVQQLGDCSLGNKWESIAVPSTALCQADLQLQLYLSRCINVSPVSLSCSSLQEMLLWGCCKTWTFNFSAVFNRQGMRGPISHWGGKLLFSCFTGELMCVWVCSDLVG